MPLDSGYRLPSSLPDEIEGLREAIDRYRAGLIDRDQFRRLRGPHGIYEQRESGTFMLRVRLPAGMVRPDAMRILARLSREHGNGTLHLTTRQDIQLHGVGLDAIYPVLCALHEVGLTTKGAGGNSIRNIVACPHAGVCWHEAFDVTPYVMALNERLLAEPGASDLPRKFKIAFSGCPRDCGGATISDVGFIAHRNGEASFSVHVGGGLGASSRVGQPLDAAISPEDCCRAAEAVKRVFREHGDASDRKRARLRFLIERVGIEAFQELYVRESEVLAGIRLQPRPPLQLALHPPAAAPDDEELRRAFERWRERNTAPQSLQGFRLVHVPVFLGDIAADQFHRLADVAARFGERQIRVSARQSIVLRWVAQTELPELYEALEALHLTDVRAPIVRDIVSCTGPQTCQLGLCRSRDLARAISSALDESGLDLYETGVRIHISGCQNACSRHPIAPIALYGVAKRVDDRLVPHYVIQFGGRVGEGRTRLAQGTVALPARRVPTCLVQLLRAFRSSMAYPVFDEYLQDYAEEVARLLNAHQEMPAFEEGSAFYCDWGSAEPFSLADRGGGECSGT